MFSPPGLDPNPNLNNVFVLNRPLSLSPEPVYTDFHRNISDATICSDDSDDTIDIESDGNLDSMGCPLRRMNQTSPWSSRSESEVSEDSDDEHDDRLSALYQACLTARLESSDHHDHERDPNDALDSCSDTSETSSIAWDEVDFESLVDSLPERYSNDHCIKRYHSLTPSTHPALFAPLTLHTLDLPANPNPDPSQCPESWTDDSVILLLFLALNTPQLRSDPWNPVPRILRAVERIRQDQDDGSKVFLFHPPLVPLTSNDNTSCPDEQCKLAHWIDFLRQTLEGLAFLHENAVVWGGFDDIEPELDRSSDPLHPPGLETSMQQVDMFMMDISSDPEAFTSTPPTFDRSRYPVKYYFTNFRKARKVSDSMDASFSSLFNKEVQSCGSWMERLILSSKSLRSRLGPPFLPLTQAMRSGTFTADGAKKLFEARVKSLNLNKDKLLWDEKIPAVQWRPFAERRFFVEEQERSSLRRARTISIALSTNSDSQPVPGSSKRPGLRASRARSGVQRSGGGTWLRPLESDRFHAPGPIVRSLSNPIPVPRENKRKDVFGDLSFVKAIVKPPSSGVFRANLTTSVSDPLSRPLHAHSPSEEKERDEVGPDPAIPISPTGDTNGIRTVSPTSPVFTIPSLDLNSLVTFPSSPTSNLPHQQGSLRQRRRKTLASGSLGMFGRRAPSSSSMAETNLLTFSMGPPSRPPSLVKIGRSMSTPLPVARTGIQ
ncbi:hypothetical protein GYMLUDRAFT_53464 [Collybiopsis luxurians FD-317 M1]|nr:hypothetical protein GYMLUDRAFT_53464 [Collybiopsis luxurians FD-317 M1]